jgi:hypothetical protein
LALVEQLLGTAQLADDLLGVVAFAFHGASPGQLLPIGKLSYRKDHFLGSTSHWVLPNAKTQWRAACASSTEASYWAP